MKLCPGESSFLCRETKGADIFAYAKKPFFMTRLFYQPGSQSSNTCLVKHAYLYMAFNLLMAEFDVLCIRREETITRKKVLVIGHDNIGKY